MPGSPMIRGYDSSVLFREYTIEKIKHLYVEIDTLQKLTVSLENPQL